MRADVAAILSAALGCRSQTGTDMLFEQIPAYLEFFDLPTTAPKTLHRVARIAH
ncbi:hypothetical protein [Alloyangia pacifica]|uniref:hypothetical protein n=1 Tax=Alloyangia pacifica TaxID=311180 RepID=UPI001C2F3347|nr:hypothetical protein [Alloyangia pacifica]